MKNYVITVNGNVYDVTVEETGSTPSAPRAPRKAAPAPAPVAAAPAPAPAAAPAPAPAPAAPASAAGSIRVESGAAGKVLSVVAKVGQQVQAGDTIVVLEAMKMEIPAVAPQAGTVVTIDVAANDTVEAGGLLATLN